jgi:hypothetical protein
MADEILVADAGSTDETPQVVRQFGACRIIERQTSDPVEFETWARRAATHPWILRVLPNERLNPELGRQVQDVLAGEPSKDGFRISRQLLLRGHRLDYGGFDDEQSVRLFRKDAGHFVLSDGRAELVVAAHKTGQLPSRLFFETCPSIEQRLGELVQIATREARAAHQQGLRPQRRQLLWRAPWQFIRAYFLRGGWLDGWAGLHACWLSALSIYLRETLLWELHEPAQTRFAAQRDGLQTLKVFDPSSASETTLGAQAALDAGQDDSLQKRSAA